MNKSQSTPAAAVPNQSPVQFKTVAIVKNLKVIVPPVCFVYEDSDGQKKSIWRAGVLNRISKKIQPLGSGQPAIARALNYRLRNGEVIFYQTGHRQSNLIIYKYFFNIGQADFGRAICCQAEIKEKIIGEKRYTEISFSKTNSRWKRVLTIGDRKLGAEKTIKIKNSTDVINILQLRRR